MRLQSIISRIDRHADLFEKMMAKLGVREEMAEIHNVGPVYRRAAMRCMGCTNSEECKAWLDTTTKACEAPDYCRNRALFERLKAQMALPQN